jgi:conjugative relaxase-like TrwC/TraI family protein
MQVSRSDTCAETNLRPRQHPAPSTRTPGSARMHVSTRALGARDGDLGRAAGQIVEYLESGVTSGPQAIATAPDDDGLDRYYADSSETPGQWVGRGFSAVRPRGAVERETFTRVLLGQDPVTGQQLVGATGSAGRAELAGRRSRATGTTDCLDVDEVADVLNVHPSYVRRLLARSVVEQEYAVLPSARLVGNRDEHGRWWVARTEVQRFAEERRKPSVVVGYDVTFSVPKSVSVLWAALGAPERGEIVAAVDGAVAAGVDYLEEHAAYIRVKGQRVRSDGLVAASYLHGTSRALEPQLHRHVVIANIGAAGDRVQTLDGTQLHLHQRTAAALAGAELRRQLTDRLGVRWGAVRNGKADIVGVPQTVLRSMSTRSAEIGNLVAELGKDTSAARQVAAYQTRAAKQAVPAAELRAGWLAHLEAEGFGPENARACLGVVDGPAPLTPADRTRLAQELGALVTEDAACFDRRDVLRHVADWSGDRLTAHEVSDIADRWLASEDVVRIGRGRSWRPGKDAIQLADGRRIRALTGAPLYTTLEMLELEERARSALLSGVAIGAGAVPAEVVVEVLADYPTIGHDQAELVRAITGSGDRIQMAIGPAGTGKTFALDVAARAWRAAGYRPMGAAVGGTAAEVLGRATGMPSTTVASLLTRLDLADPGDQVLDPTTVVVIDEASTLGNRDLDRLIRHVERAGATVRLVGDPAQHSAVPAGGLWRALVELCPDRTPRLTELRRQRGEHLAAVRSALEEYRAGKVTAALQRLHDDGRVIEADDPQELLDRLVADWYADREQRRGQPDLPASSMVAEHHHERLQLNDRARALLIADGTLAGPALTVEGAQFQAGDEVIARLQDRRLRPAGGGRSSYVRNGTRGVVIGVIGLDSSAPRLLVDFDGRGPVDVPWTYLSAEIRPGVHGGLAHSYALTSYAAQGETYEAARHLATERSSRPGVYVGLSRGMGDARLYVTRSVALDPEAAPEHGLPEPEPIERAHQAVVRRLAAEDIPQVASEIDPDLRDIARLARDVDVRQLLGRADGDQLAARAFELAIGRLAERACIHPPADLLERLGSRPLHGAARERWERAVGAVAAYRSVAPEATPGDLSRRPNDPSIAAFYDRAERALRAVPGTADAAPSLEPA